MFRKINLTDVIPRQMIPFMREQTLQGPKLDVYLLMKILKQVMEARTRSYDVKYSMNETYFISLPNEEKLGEAALAIMDYKMMRGIKGLLRN